jgi:nucleoside-diphosphate-sugar epimerase
MDNPIVREDLEEIYNSDKSGWEIFAEKSILVTGATGMLPSYLIFFFLYLNEVKKIPIRVFAFVRSEFKAKKYFGKYLDCDYLNLIIGDLCKEFQQLNVDIDYIIHGASLASPQFYKTNPVETIIPNVLGTYQLLEYSRNRNITNFLFFSSGSIYGKWTNEKAINETSGGWIDPLSIKACYSESKRMGETMCSAWFRQYQVPTRIVRIRHTYGPTLNLENDNRSFSYFVSCLMNGSDIILNSDGSEELEFLYISDAISAILKILRYGRDGQAYNLSNSKERIAISKLADLILSFAPEKDLQVQKRSDPGMENKITQKTDTSKLEKLGWLPQVSIETGFSRTIEAIRLMRNINTM